MEQFRFGLGLVFKRENEILTVAVLSGINVALKIPYHSD